MKTTLKIACRLLSLSLLAFASSAAVPSCGGSTTGDESETDGVTHWLEDCDEASDCGELECLCGVCTRRCTEAAACAGLDEGAACTVIEGCAEPLDDAVCTLPGSDAGSACPPEGCVQPGCAPMDATSTDLCAVDQGYAWNGERCRAIGCTCEGADCGELYASFGACEQANLTCHIGLAPQCQRTSDCVLDFAGCCGDCGLTPIERLVAIRGDTYETYRARACQPDEGCPDCVSSISPDVLALCVGFECRPVDITPLTECATDADCHMRYKDCCECASLPTAANVIALSDLAGYEQVACTPGLECTTCDFEYPLDMRAACVDGQCRVENIQSP